MRIRRATLIVVFGLAILAVPLAADAQQAAKVPRIGYLGSASPSAAWPSRDAFRQGLRKLGYIEGQNIVIEDRSAEGKLERLPDLAAELVLLKVDVIVASTTAPALAAKNATTTIPIVIVYVADPVGRGLVASLARPGGNITGLSWGGIELSGKQLELLKEAVPKLSRVAVLTNPASEFHRAVLREAEAAAGALAVQLQPFEVRDPTEFDSAFAAMTRARAGALMVPGDPMFLIHQTRLAALAAKNRLPAMYGVRAHVEAGGLMSYAPSLLDTHRRAAIFVDKILKGTKPADLPVEQPTKFELVINLKTAKALGLTIPPSVLIRADQIIQ